MFFRRQPLFSLTMAAVCTSVQALPDMTISSTPQGVIYNNTAYVVIKPLTKEAYDNISTCRVHFSSHEAGNQVAGHDITISDVTIGKASPKVSVEFFPNETEPDGSPKLSIGVYHYIISCGDNQGRVEYHTPEFPIRIEANQKPTLITPTAVTGSYMPMISWQAVTNVPAYHVLVSDQVVRFEEETYSVSNISIIWQAITTKTSIMYGTPDPSGNFLIPPPPLSPDINYTLIIFNNYDGRSLSATSDKAKDFRIFKIRDDDSPALLPPRNLSPASGDTLFAADQPEIKFTWTSSPAGANTYKLFIYSKEHFVGFQEPILIPVWSSETTDTSLVFKASGTLTNRLYSYKIFANSAEGKSLAGDTTSFFYKTEEREVVFYTRTRMQMASKVDTMPIGNVNLEIQSLERSRDPLPLVTDAMGWTSRSLPFGQFELIFQKPGFFPLRRSLEINEQSDRAVKFITFLEPYSAVVTGQVLNARDIPVFNASVTATDNFQKTVTAKSDADGRFILGLIQGQYRMQVVHPDFKQGVDTTITLKDQKHFTLEAMLLENLTTYLTGDIFSDKGTPLAGVLLQALNDESREVQRTLSDGRGRFTMALAKGEYKLVVSKMGFGNLSKRFLLMDKINLSLVMASGASLITGRVYGLSNSITGQQTAPLDNVLMTFVDENRADTQVTRSDETGNYHFSVSPPGNYRLSASHPGGADTAVVSLSVPEKRGTLTKDLTLNLLAEIHGEVRLNPFTRVRAEDMNILLRDSASGRVVQSTFPSVLNSNYLFSFQNVPDGIYTISAGVQGYGLDSLMVVLMENLAWRTGCVINLNQSDKTLRFTLIHKGLSIPGKINFQAPLTALLSSQEILDKAPYGQYALSVIPDSAYLVPKENYRMVLERQSVADTTLVFSFPFVHVPSDKSLKRGPPTFTFQNLSDTVNIDSAFLIYEFGGSWDTARFQPPFDVDNTLKLDSGLSGGNFRYYLDIFSSEGHFSNSAASAHFAINLLGSDNLTHLQLDKTDTVNLGLDIPLCIQVSGFDALGNNLDSLMDKKATVAWKSGQEYPLTLDSTDKRRVRVTATKLFKGVAPITVNVSYNAVTHSATLYCRAVKGSINKLVISSTVGNNIFITPLIPVNFFVAGLDTTVTPPLKIETTPEFSLSPPNAGIVQNQKLLLNQDFIGPLRVEALHREKEKVVRTELGIDQYEFLRGLNVGQLIKPDNSSRVLIHNPYFELIVPDSALNQKTQGLLVLNKRKISSQYTSNRKIALKGELFEMSNPLKARFARKPLLKIGLPEGTSKTDSRLGIFSDTALQWLPIPPKAAKFTFNTFSGQALITPMAYLDGFFYGILNNTKPLSVSDFEVIPNPFSPMVLAERDGNTRYGTRIRFTPHSKVSDRVTITLKIYNMRGELVRILEPLRSMPKEAQEYYWDGKTDSGLWARNGRYLVMLIVRETVAEDFKKYIKPVVLYK